MVRLMGILAAFAMCLSGTQAHARTLYVDAASGSDAVSYAANSAGQPWKSIGRAAWGSTSYSSPNAAQAAQAGDVVRIAAGVYWENGNPQGGRFVVHLNPTNSGTAANPIVFRGVGVVQVRMNPGYRGGMIGCANRNHITWDNFHIDDYYGGSTADTGPVVFSGSEHCRILNSDVKGHPGTYYHGYPTFGGNYRGISLEPANHTVIKNNRIHNFTGQQNEAGIMAYDSNDTIIENNEIFGNGQGVFIKGVHPGRTQARNIIRYNVVRNNWAGIRVLAGTDTDVFQNIITGNTGAGIWFGWVDTVRARAVNNTLYRNGHGFVLQGAAMVGLLMYNNLVVDHDQAFYNWDQSNPSTQDIATDRNLFSANRTHAEYGGGGITFANWKSVYGHESGGVSANPQFVDAARNDFRLGPASPARTLGIDVLDLNRNGSTTDVVPAGAYLTGAEVIGLTGPRPPTGLRIVE